MSIYSAAHVYDITSYFRSAFIEARKKRQKMPPPTDLGRISPGESRFACPTNWWASCSPYAMTYISRRSSSSSITKSAARISQKQFDVDSPNFISNLRTDEIYSHTGYDLTGHIRSEVIAKKNGRKCHIRRLLAEFLPNGLNEEHKIVHAYRG